MSELVIIVEGQTEQAFVQQHLQRYLGRRGLMVSAVLPGRRKNHGGVPHWETARDDIVRTLHSGACCTTMFDFYGLPHTWPGRAEAARLPYHQRADYVEAAITRKIRHAMHGRLDEERFAAYIQLHEFEALAFADVAVLASVMAPVSGAPAHVLARHFEDVLKEVGDDPEAINDSYETCPSRRILSIAPRYKKVVHGAIVTGRIGMDALCDRCRHFSDWIDRLVAMGVENRVLSASG